MTFADHSRILSNGFFFFPIKRVWCQYRDHFHVPRLFSLFPDGFDVHIETFLPAA